MHGEEAQSRLLLPPPLPSQVVRRPVRNGRQLVLASLAAATHAPAAWALFVVARMLRLAATAGPVLVFLGAVRSARAAGSDPIAAILVAASDPAVHLVGGGLAAAGFFASLPIEAAAAALGLPVLRDRLGREPAPPDASFGLRFGRIVAAAALAGLVALVAAAAAWPPVFLAFRTWAQANEAGVGAGAGLLASLALALVLVIVLAGSLLLRLVAEAAVVRAGAFDDRPVAAFANALALVLKKPLVFLLAFYLLALAALLTSTLFTFPAAMAPTPGSALWLRGGAELVVAVAGGLFALARLGVFVGAAADES